MSSAGLAEQLTGAPALLRQYRDARYAEPLLHAVLQTAIDWVRVGMPRPIPTADLTTLAMEMLLTERPDLDPSEAQAAAAIETARTPPVGAGRVAALRTELLPDRTRGYQAFSYLVAADDEGARTAWQQVVDTSQEIDLVTGAAINLAALSAMSGNVDHARQLLHLATQYGDSGATAYAATLDPDQLIRAEALQRLGSMIEDSDAMNFLGIAAHSRGMRRGSTGLDPPRLVTWSHRFYCTHDEIRPTSPAATDHTDLHNG